MRVPAVALIASGGHTELFHVRAPHDYVLLGTRRDDAAGEAFDKGARLLGLGAGGGAALERLAGEAAGPPPRLFGRIRTQQPLDFSFSGLKTALARFLEQDQGRTARASVAAAYQGAIVEHLCDRTRAALQETAAGCLMLGGGVAGNGLLRRELSRLCRDLGVELLLPLPEYCTDNAAMIAVAGYSRLSRGERDGLELACAARAPLCGQSGPASR